MNQSGVKCLQRLTVDQSQMFSAKQQHSEEKLLCIIYKYKLTDVPCIFLIWILCGDCMLKCSISLGEVLTLGKELEPAWLGNKFLKPTTQEKQVLGP